MGNDRWRYRHPTALIEGVGARARIHAFVQVFPGAPIGDDVNLNRRRAAQDRARPDRTRPPQCLTSQ